LDSDPVTKHPFRYPMWPERHSNHAAGNENPLQCVYVRCH
jgi:hypothetical protein